MLRRIRDLNFRLNFISIISAWPVLAAGVLKVKKNQSCGGAPRCNQRDMFAPPLQLYGIIQNQLFSFDDMLFFFLVSLVLNVIFNNIGSCSVSHCSNVSPITPEFTTPKLFFNLRVFFEDFSRSYVFYNLHHSRRRMFWLSPQQKDVRDHHRIYIRQVDIRF